MQRKKINTLSCLNFGGFFGGERKGCESLMMRRIESESSSSTFSCHNHLLCFSRQFSMGSKTEKRKIRFQFYFLAETDRLEKLA